MSKKNKSEQTMTTKDFGRDDELMAIAAFRYCLSHQAYMMDVCADWLIKQWPNISETAKWPEGHAWDKLSGCYRQPWKPCRDRKPIPSC